MNSVKFDQEIDGYNREQVDGYIRKIEKEYKGLLAAYEALENSCKRQQAELEDTRRQMDVGAAAAVMMKAEMLARHTESAAEAQAGLILARARQDASDMIAAAKIEAEELEAAKASACKELLRIQEMVAGVTGGRTTSVLWPEGTRS